jgi:nitroreductase
VNCKIDIRKEGNSVLAYLPFNPRTEFDVHKGVIIVKCIIDGTEFKSKLMSKGNEKFCLFFSKQLLKNLGLIGDEHLNILLSIEPDMATDSNSAEPELLDNDTINAIRERVSIRSFTDRKINNLIFDTILNAGLCAPSATNKRPYHFLLTQSREKMINLMTNNTYANMLTSAPASIIICGDKIIQGIPEWLIEDCSAATQNMLHAIHSLGLGGVWCGVKQGSDFYKDIVNEFKLPTHIRPVSLIAFGYTDEKKVHANRHETNKIHIESW